MKIEISELLQLMFVGLVGANREVERLIEDFLDKHNKPPHGFLFYECLLHLPIPKTEQGLEPERWVFLPIPHHLARESLVMIKPESIDSLPTEYEEVKKRFGFPTSEDIASIDILVKMEDSLHTRAVYEYWKRTTEEERLKEAKEKSALFEHFDLRCVDLQKDRPFFMRIKNLNVEKMREQILQKLGDSDCEALSKKSFLLLHGITFPQFESFPHNKEITAFLIPIASSEVFYGNLVVYVPHFDWDKNEDKNNVKQLASQLSQHVKKHYVPALALIHEHFFEDQVAKGLDETKEEGIIELLFGPHVLVLPDKNEKNDGYKNPFCRRKGYKELCWDCPYSDWEELSDNVVEKYLHKLWQDRKTIGEKKYIEKSLIFRKRLYTDPTMIDLLEGWLKPSKAKLRKEEDYLPSVLVEASPSAGKEHMVRLFKLFSAPYNMGEKIYRLNMASLKPEVVAPVAMVGGEVTWEKSIFTRLGHEKKAGIPEDIRLVGLLNEIRERTRIEFECFVRGKGSYKGKGLDKEVKQRIINTETRLNKLREQENNGKLIDELRNEITSLTELKNSLPRSKPKPVPILKGLSAKGKAVLKKLFGRFPTLVLDELNSMSVESQGVLLRFIENSEITPIGGYEDKMWVDGGEVEKEYREFLTDFLVVGLMNEDPGEITRERAIEFLRQKDSYISGLLGDVLYEHILRIRRLRPDLRHRMMRYGEFKIPELARHRADIPVIFYIELKNVKEDYFPGSEIRVTIDALECLMRPEIDWPENVRQLQALIMKVVEIVYEDYQDRRYKEEPLQMIDQKNLIIIREKHIRKAMEEIDMHRNNK